MLPKGKLRKRRSPWPLRSLIAILAGVGIAGTGTPQSFAQTAPNCSGPLRKINIGVAVAPPNVVHTAPYVAKALGYFAKRCIDANIIQFDGGAAGTSVTAVGAGHGHLQPAGQRDRPAGCRARQVWGLAPRPPQAYVVSARDQDAGRPQGQAAVGDRRRRRRLQLADGARGAARRRAHRRRRAVHLAGHRRPPARLRRRPDRRRRAASRGCLPRPSRRSRARTSLGMVSDCCRNTRSIPTAPPIDDRQGPRPPARHHRGDDRGEPHDPQRQGQGHAGHHGGDAEAASEAIEYAIGVITKGCMLSVNAGFVRERTRVDAPEQHQHRRYPAGEEAHLRADRRPSSSPKRRSTRGRSGDDQQLKD